jgi:hypothetical protein
MASRRLTATTAQVLGRLVAAAGRRDVPILVAEEARAVTARTLALDASSPCGGSHRRRVEAYFWAVVKRRVLRAGVAPHAAARLLAASVVEDLKSAGRDGSAIWRELELGFAGRLPDEVLEEYRLRLCA